MATGQTVTASLRSRSLSPRHVSHSQSTLSQLPLVTTVAASSRNHSASPRHVVPRRRSPSAYLADSLQLTANVPGRRRLRSTDTMTLQVPSTRRSTIGDRAFPAAAARAWNSLPPATKAANSLLQFRRETKTHLFHQSFLD